MEGASASAPPDDLLPTKKLAFKGVFWFVLLLILIQSFQSLNKSYGYMSNGPDPRCCAGKKVEVSFEKEDYRDAWFPAIVLEDAGHGSFLVEYQGQVVDDDEAQVTVDYLHIRPPPPLLRDRSFDLLEKVDAFYDFGWWSGVVTKQLADSRYIVSFKHTNKEKELTYLELRPHMDWKDGTWFTSSQQRKRGKGGEPKPNSQLIAPVKKPGRPLRKSPHGVQGKSVQDIVNIPVVIGLESNGVHLLGGPKSSVKQTSGQKEELVDSQTPTSVKDKEVNNSESGTVSSRKRKRGRPPNVLAQSPKISAAVNKQNEDAAPNPVGDEDYLKKPVSLPTSLGVEKDAPTIPDKEQLKLVSNENMPKQKNRLGSVMKICLSKKGKLLEQASGEQPKKKSSVKGKQGRRRTTTNVNTDSSNQDSEDASIEKVDERSKKYGGASRKDDMGIDVLASSIPDDDDEPLSMWLEGMHPPPTVDMSGACVGVRTKEEQEMKRGKVVNCAAAGTGGESVGGGGRGDIESHLPFVKTSPLWETMGGMEVFGMIPQKPHFRGLVNKGYKESVRQGLAIGSMVTFASVVEKTVALRFDDDRSTIEDYLENLVELESDHGFNVKVVRDRLMTLMLLKSKNGELNKQLNGIRSKIVEKSVERSKVDEEIEEINKHIRELSEKRRLAVLKKEMKKSEIRGLEKRVEGMNEGILGIKSEFEELASSPWQP